LWLSQQQQQSNVTWKIVVAIAVAITMIRGSAALREKKVTAVPLTKNDNQLTAAQWLWT